MKPTRVKTFANSISLGDECCPGNLRRRYPWQGWVLRIQRSTVWVCRDSVAEGGRIPISWLRRNYCLAAKSCLTLLPPQWTVACQDPLSMGFPRHEYISFSRGYSRPRDWTQVSCLAGGFFTTELLGKSSLNEDKMSQWEKNCSESYPHWASLVAQVKNLPAMQETWFDPWVGKILWRKA